MNAPETSATCVPCSPRSENAGRTNSIGKKPTNATKAVALPKESAKTRANALEVSQTLCERRLQSDLARHCLPASSVDANRDFAWINSVFLLFLCIGLVGAKPAPIITQTPPPTEEVIPTIVEPTAPSPPPTEKQQDQTDQDPADTPQVVVVALNSPNINFAIPTVGNLVVPSALAKAPPVGRLSANTQVRNQPTAIDSTGEGGQRPQPPYPKSALQELQQGSVTLSIAVDNAGIINTIQVKESSGFPLLDRSALEFIKRHWIMPPGAATRIYEATISYRINLN